MSGKLAWKNLINDKCPQCGTELDRAEGDDYKCCHCGMFCRYERGQEIVMNIQFDEEIKLRDNRANKFLEGYDTNN